MDTVLKFVISADSTQGQLAVKKMTDAFEGMGNESEKSGKKAEGAFNSFMSSLSKVGVTMTAIGATISGSLGLAIKSFAEADRATTQLNQVLRSTGQVAGVTADAALRLSDSLAKVTAFDDDVITDAQALLLSFTKIGKDVFPAATEAVLDLATAMGGDVRGAAIQLGKALQDPEQGLSALRRSGVSFSDAQTEVIKKLFDTGHAAEAQRMILEELSKEFGGRARAAAQDLGGQLDQLKNSMGNLMEDVGRALSSSGGFQEFTGQIRGTIEAVRDWIRENPELAAQLAKIVAIVGGVMTVLGPVLIILPKLVAGFTAVGGAAGAFVTAFGGLIPALTIATPLIVAAGVAIGATAKAFLEWKAAQAGLNTANKQLGDVTEQLNGKLKEIGRGVERGTDSWEAYTDRVRQAARENLSALSAHEKEKKALDESNKAKQDAAVKTAELAAKQKDAAKAAKEATAEHERWANAIGVTSQKLSDNLVLGRKYVDWLIESGASAERVTDAQNHLAEATKKYIAEAKGLPELLKEVNYQFAAVDTTLDGFSSGMELAAVNLKSLAGINQRTAQEANRAWEPVPDKMHEVNFALEAMGIKSDHVLYEMSENADQQFNKIRDSGVASYRELQLAEAKAIQAQIDAHRDAGPEILASMQATVDGINKKWGDTGKAANDAAKKMSDEFGQQVSTIVTDFGKGVADMIFAGKGFGETMKGIFSEWGKSVVRTLIETLFNPLKSLLQEAAKWFLSLFSGEHFDTKGLDKMVDSFKGAFEKIGGFFKDLTGKIGSFFGAGGALGNIIGGGVLAGAGFGIEQLISRFTRRGREKVTATGAAEDLSNTVWQDIVPAVQKGTLTVQQGIEAIQGAWKEYTDFLHANLKDTTVIQRSIESQQNSLTEGLAALEKIGQDQAKGIDALSKSKALDSLRAMYDEFNKSFVMTDAFAKQIKEMGGNLQAFKEAADIPQLKSLQSDFQNLKQNVDSLLPVQKSAMELFFQTGEITDELRMKVLAAGGSLEQFKAFADLRVVKTGFDEATAKFKETGIASDELLEKIKRYASPETSGAFENLVNKAKESGVSLGQLADNSEASAKTIEDAFTSAAEGIDSAFVKAAKDLSAELGRMDQNLTDAIAVLNKNLVAAMNELIRVMGGVPIKAEEVVTQTNNAFRGIQSPTITADFSRIVNGAREAVSAANAHLANLQTRADFQNYYRVTGLVPGFQSGGIVMKPTLAMVGEAGPEAIIPLNRSASTGSNSGALPLGQMGAMSGAITVNVNIGEVKANDPKMFIDGVVKAIENNSQNSRNRLLGALGRS